MKTIEKIKKHPAVVSISDERGSGDGFWVYLKSGWTYDNPGEHSLHEDTPSQCLPMLSRLMKCDCSDECQKAYPAKNVSVSCPVDKLFGEHGGVQCRSIKYFSCGCDAGYCERHAGITGPLGPKFQIGNPQKCAKHQLAAA